MRRRRLRFSTELLALQVAVVAAVVVVGFALFAVLLDRQLSSEYGQRALAVARSFAQDSDLRDEVAAYSAGDTAGPSLAPALAAGPVQAGAEAVRVRNDALFVVVTDDRGLRLAHPDPAELGLPVSTDPSTALAGGEEIVVQRGTLGDSARAKVPVYAPDDSSAAGTVVGAVSVGIDTEEIAAALGEDLQVAALYAVAALALGVGASALLNRRLRRLTLGVEPEELAGMASEHEAVLGGIGEAVVAVDPAGRITVANGEARRLFALELTTGTAVGRSGLPTRVTTLLTGTRSTAEPVLVVAGEKVLVCSVRTVHRAGRDLGLVLTARDRTDLELLTRQLDAVQTMSAALRAQRHEFANRLHVVHGLLAHGDRVEAGEYVQTLLGSGPLGTLLDGLDTVRDPTVQAFLSAKAAHARERAVTLRIGPETWLDAAVTDPVAVTTVLGNLLDNACDAAAFRHHAARLGGGRTARRRHHAVRHGRRQRGRGAGRDDRRDLPRERQLPRRGRPRSRPRPGPAGRPGGHRRRLAGRPRRGRVGSGVRGPAARGAGRAAGTGPSGNGPGASGRHGRLDRSRRGGRGPSGAGAGMSVRVLVVDDDFRVARMHAEVAAAQPGFQVVQVVSTVAHALRTAAAQPAEGRIDLALVDLYLPDGSGLDLVRRLDCDVVVLSAATESSLVRAALRAGAVGYLIKPFGQDVLAERLTAYARFRGILDRADTVSQAELDQAVRALHARSQHRPKGHSTLTDQAVSRAVLDAVQPLSAADVAEQVGVSRATAQRYLAELAESGRILMQLRYGATGRPEHRYSPPG